MTTYNATHVNTILADTAVKYRPKDLIADQVAPVHPVKKMSDLYWTYDQRDAARIVDDEVAAVGEPNQAHFGLSDDSYLVKRRALFDYVPLDEVNNEDPPLDLMEDTTEDLMTKLLLGREKRVADLVTTAGSYDASHKATASYPWTDQVNGDPVADILAARRACAMTPNVLIVNELVFDTLATHPKVIVTLRGTGGAVSGVASPEEIARYFRFDKVIVGAAKYDTANAGQSAASLSYIWPSTVALVARIPDNPRTKDAMLSRTFRYQTGQGEGSSQGSPVTADTGESLSVSMSGISVQTWFEPKRGTQGATGIKVGFSDAEKLVSPVVGFLISGL